VSESVDIVWLRDDFRLDDQPAIHAVANRSALFVCVHDDACGGARPLGGAAKSPAASSEPVDMKVAPKGTARAWTLAAFAEMRGR
jgi:hypothetical protein